MTNFQRKGAASNTQVGRDFKSKVRPFFAKQGLNLQPHCRVEIRTTWWDQGDAIRAAARYLGFRRTSSAIQKAFKSAINGAIRQGLIEREGEMIRAVK